jgi:hypothetical protein
MKANSYTREILVSNTPSAAYRALTTEFDKWWTASSTPNTEVGDTVTFRFDPTYWTMRVTKLTTNQNVELKCIEAHHIHEGLPESILKEWEGTILRWTIQPYRDHTKILFVHEGLVPSLDCYEICEQGWDYFFVDSLKNYLDHGDAAMLHG